MMVWPLPSMISAVPPTIEQTRKNYEVLTKKLQELTAVPPGSYALFHHNAFVWERITDIQLIFDRLIDNCFCSHTWDPLCA